MTCVLVVIKVKLIPLASSLEHDSNQDPGTDIKSGQFYIHFSFCLSNFHQPRPVHFLISSLDDSITNSEQMLAWIGSQNIFSLDLSCLENSFLSLFIILFSHNIQFLGSFNKSSFFVLQLISSPCILILKLFMFLHQFFMTTRYLIQLLL